MIKEIQRCHLVAAHLFIIREEGGTTDMHELLKYNKLGNKKIINDLSLNFLKIN